MNKLLQKGYVISPDIVIEQEDEFIEYLSNLDSKPFVITSKIYNDFLSTQPKTQTIVLRKRHHSNDIVGNVDVVKNYKFRKSREKTDINKWMKYFNKKYDLVSSLIRNRFEMKDVVSIDRVCSKQGKTEVSLIVMVRDIRKTAKGNTLINMEDQTGSLLGLVTGTKKKLMESVSELVPDDIVGIKGSKSGDFVFISELIFPEVPSIPEKKSPQEGSVAFISDLHIGSKMFMPKEFENFLGWLNGKSKDEKQLKISSDIKYLFVLGDLVDGVGVYPEQQRELEISDIYKQYEKFNEYMREIPEHIQIVVIPGNHDFVRLEEPQPEIGEEMMKELSGNRNIFCLSNPSYVNIHKTEGFPGFDVLNYHGYSFDYYVANVEKLRNQGGYDSADKIIEFLLRKRHLAPSYGSVPISPLDEDYLFIDKIPDIVATGHIHKSKIANYKNIITLCSSCWQSKTVFQERVGHHPEPGMVPVIDLKTRKISLLKFA